MKLLQTLGAALLTLAAAACGTNNDNGTDTATADVTRRTTDPVDFEHGDRHLTPQQLDSLVNHPDDLTPGEAAGALKHLYNRVNQTSGTKREVAMRNFKDFYDIMIENHGNDFRAAIEKYRRSDTLDFAKIYDDYATVLIVGDDTYGGISADDLKTDTIKTYQDSLTNVETVSSAR